jgi:peroxiredoxin
VRGRSGLGSLLPFYDRDSHPADPPARGLRRALSHASDGRQAAVSAAGGPQLSVDPYVLPEGLPVPEDDGAADHLTGSVVPSVVLESSAGPVDVAEVCAGRGVIYVYPRAGRPGVPLLPGWDAIPGARGCTPQSCGFRDHAGELAELCARVAGVSVQALADQIEFAERNAMPFPVLSDPQLRLRDLMGLPTFPAAGLELYKRLAFVAEHGTIVKVFYPVFPPDRNAADVLAYLRG